jgi:hypothetical protein
VSARAGFSIVAVWVGTGEPKDDARDRERTRRVSRQPSLRRARHLKVGEARVGRVELMFALRFDVAREACKLNNPQSAIATDQALQRSARSRTREKRSTTLEPGADQIAQERGAELHPVLRIELAPAEAHLGNPQAEIGADPMSIADARERLRVLRRSRSAEQ